MPDAKMFKSQKPKIKKTIEIEFNIFESRFKRALLKQQSCNYKYQSILLGKTRDQTKAYFLDKTRRDQAKA